MKRLIALIALLAMPITMVQAAPAPLVTMTVSYRLLANASKTGDPVPNVLGGSYQVDLEGTVGGASITVQVTGSDGTLRTQLTLSSTGISSTTLSVPAGSTVRAIVTGGSPSGLYLQLGGIGSGGGGSSGGTVTANQGTPGAITAGWPVISGEPADTTGTFTNATQSTAITTASADGYETGTITLTGTYGTATGTFQASDDGGTTFYNIQCTRTDGGGIENGYTGLTNVSRAWFCPVHGFDAIRVQSSAVASGTVNVHISESSPPTTGGSTVTTSPIVASSTDASGTVTTGGTFQSVFAAGPRHSCQIQNPPTATENLTVRQGATTQFNLVPGALYTCNWGVTTVSDQIFLTAPTTTHAFSAASQ